MAFPTRNHSNPELAIRWTAALGGEYVWADVCAGDFDTYVRQVREMTKAANCFGVEVAVHNHLGQIIETQVITPREEKHYGICSVRTE